MIGRAVVLASTSAAGVCSAPKGSTSPHGFYKCCFFVWPSPLPWPPTPPSRTKPHLYEEECVPFGRMEFSVWIRWCWNHCRSIRTELCGAATDVMPGRRGDGMCLSLFLTHLKGPGNKGRTLSMDFHHWAVDWPIKPVRYPLPSSSEFTLYRVADQVVKAVRECKPFILDTTGRKKLKLGKALHFEPYHGIQVRCIDQLFDNEIANQEVDDSFLQDLAGSIHTKLMERIPIQEAFQMFSIPDSHEYYNYCEQFPKETYNLTTWGAFVSFSCGRNMTLMEQRTRIFTPLWISTASSVAETQWVTGWN